MFSQSFTAIMDLQLKLARDGVESLPNPTFPAGDSFSDSDLSLDDRC